MTDRTKAEIIKDASLAIASLTSGYYGGAIYSGWKTIDLVSPDEVAAAGEFRDFTPQFGEWVDLVEEKPGMTPSEYWALRSQDEKKVLNIVRAAAALAEQLTPRPVQLEITLAAASLSVDLIWKGMY